MPCLRQLLKERCGITVAEFCRRTGLDDAALARIATGEYGVRERYVVAVVGATGCDRVEAVEALKTRSDDRRPHRPESMKAEARERYAAGESSNSIGRALRCDGRTIRHWVKNVRRAQPIRVLVAAMEQSQKAGTVAPATRRTYFALRRVFEDVLPIRSGLRPPERAFLTRLENELERYQRRHRLDRIDRRLAA